MATAEQIAALRLLIAEPTSEVFTDVMLAAMIDASPADLNKPAYDAWVVKASAAAELVDTSEGGSSRKMGDIWEQALGMAKFFGDQVPGGVEPEAPKYPRLSRLKRP